MNFSLLTKYVDQAPYPLVFATISGAHLYGFPSPDSDYDLRGVHVLPLDAVIGLDLKHETLERSGIDEGIELDLVTHDVAKFIRLMLRPNGYVLEQLLSPLVVYTSEEHLELKRLAAGCVTKFHAHHYRGFANTQWRLFEKENPPRVKPLLYVFRVLLTGIHLMKTGQLQADLLELNQHYKLPYIADLVSRKINGKEKEQLVGSEFSVYAREYERLLNELDRAYEQTFLPPHPSVRDEINQFLIDIRKRYSV
jgi:predicted nucleotidyltransferase